MEKMLKKLNNPERLTELSPEDTLRKIEFHKGDTLCDIGAGTGIFTIAAARLTDQDVYAVEINDELLDHIKNQAETENLNNIKTVRTNGITINVPGNSIDTALLVTVFHEIPGKARSIREIKRVLKKDGKLAIIEFHKMETPFGPPVAKRIDEKEITDQLKNESFLLTDSFRMGDNFYCTVFETK